MILSIYATGLCAARTLRHKKLAWQLTDLGKKITFAISIVKTLTTLITIMVYYV